MPSAINRPLAWTLLALEEQRIGMQARQMRAHWNLRLGWHIKP